jgi:Xaa-Pro dipeptidase
MIKIGVTEKEIASELTIQMLRLGGDAEAPFAPIVSSGPNGANPHASPGDRKMAAGDLLVIDWGTGYQGYVADLTRTFGIGKVEPEFQRIADIVKDANAAGRAIAAPGLQAGAVDAAAREVINTAGYGAYFTHRVGHGIGLEGHEPPYMFGENTLRLAEGMAFTIEPGIYLTGRGGVRIEDNVVVTANGVDVLSSLPRELRILG